MKESSHNKVKRLIVKVIIKKIVRFYFGNWPTTLKIFRNYELKFQC